MAGKARNNARDEFPIEVKDLLAKRVGMRCSNPNCRQPTSGPQDDPTKVLNIGVAAHITGAAKGGPRYDASLSVDARRAYDNGIWLCQNCAKLVDNDATRYTADTLREWKRNSEQAARLAIEEPNTQEDNSQSDVALVRFFAQCFDRPAFQDHFHREGSMEAFDRAIDDTITAINTGCLRARDGQVLAQANGKAFLKNTQWRETMDSIVDLLRAIRSRYELAIKSGEIHTSSRDSGNSWYCIHDRSVGDWMDSTRAEVMRLFVKVCDDAGVKAPRFPRPYPRNW